MNCPIDDKVGIEDYTQKPVVCPQCDSDLTPYYLLHKIREETEKKDGNLKLLDSTIDSIAKKKKVYKSLFLVSSLFAICSIGSYCYSLSENKKIIAVNAKTVLGLQDSINRIYHTAEEPKKANSESEIKIPYLVKKGDNPSKIAGFFYNDWRKYKKIEEDNNLHQPYTLKIGQPLIIILKK